eukprot:CAMPEP_0114628042 /NCGR_PEP_ID=MMETSP0168-20121206/12612_1 /TAXON_ID=95228 ORGANISM="Vannella sp., Strain DIVA3 517/6/12" /NCGR_SAMPLE_ID=MMETSP0168 /ASSEMBLY_ACC=CAM_ASM_000044 /LENGTH=250 /DNA_ID=CAMNT_0001839403 /DNA_START=246 /DNA_END=995 /DNA_ORIENTATION=+
MAGEGEKGKKKKTAEGAAPAFLGAAVPSFVSNFVPNIAAGAPPPAAAPVVKEEPKEQPRERAHEKIFRGRGRGRGRGSGRGRQRRDRPRKDRGRAREDRPPRARQDVVSRFDETAQDLGLDVPVALPLKKPELNAPGENATDADVVQRGIEKNSLFFMQLPRMPFANESSTAEETAAVHAMPQRLVGKLRVYKSGRVEMKVGDLVYDVTRGSETACLQQAVVIDPSQGDAVVLGNLTDRLLVSLNVDTLE